MIPKSGYRFSEKIMLKQGGRGGMTTRREVIALERKDAVNARLGLTPY